MMIKKIIIELSIIVGSLLVIGAVSGVLAKRFDKYMMNVLGIEKEDRRHRR